MSSDRRYRTVAAWTAVFTLFFATTTFTGANSAPAYASSSSTTLTAIQASLDRGNIDTMPVTITAAAVLAWVGKGAAAVAGAAVLGFAAAAGRDAYQHIHDFMSWDHAAFIPSASIQDVDESLFDF